MKAIDIIKEFEGCQLQSYLCPAKVWTIGWGTTIYPNGEKVKQGETITQEQAETYLNDTIQKVKDQLLKLKLRLNINQFEALTSFIYNIGIGQFKTSTLYAKAIINPNDPAIKNQFRRWDKSGGKVLNGLVKRRIIESNLYFT